MAQESSIKSRSPIAAHPVTAAVIAVLTIAVIFFAVIRTTIHSCYPKVALTLPASVCWSICP